jgi:hypothetical protein
VCVSDYRLGRLIRSRQRITALALAATLDVPADPLRLAIGFYSANSLGTEMLLIDIEGTLTDFFELRPNNQYLVFTAAIHGDLVTKRWQVRGTSAANASISLVEWWLPENVLRDNFDKLIRGY